MMMDPIAPPDVLPADKNFWARAFQDHAPALRAFFQRQLRNASDIDDALQDLWLRVCGRSPEGISNVGAYLFQAAQNVLVDRSRRAIVRKAGRHEELQDHHHPVEGITPDRVLLGKEALARIVSRIQTLPERTRDIFVLHRFEGMAHSEIAKAMGISVSAVEKHIMKAMRDLMLAERELNASGR